jgi:hypothetical protein
MFEPYLFNSRGITVSTGDYRSKEMDQNLAHLITKAQSLIHLSLVDPSQHCIEYLSIRMKDTLACPDGIKSFKVVVAPRSIAQSKRVEDWSGIWELVQSWKALERVDFCGEVFAVEKWRARGGIHTSIKYLRLRRADLFDASELIFILRNEGSQIDADHYCASYRSDFLLR